MYTTPEQVLDAVRKYIKDKHPGGANLEVVPEGVYQDREWWHVYVRPSFQPSRRFEYYEALAMVEQELLKFENLIVLFVPTDPEAGIAVARDKEPCPEGHGYWARTPQTHRFAGLRFMTRCSECAEGVVPGVFAQ